MCEYCVVDATDIYSRCGFRQKMSGQRRKCVLTKFNTVSTISRLLTSPTWISPTSTANFILIFRIGTAGLIIPAGRTTEPEPDIIIVSPAAAETAAACCPWPAGGLRSESDSEPGIVTGLSLVISSKTERFQVPFQRSLPVMSLTTAVEHQEKQKDTRKAVKNKSNTQERNHSLSVESPQESSGEWLWSVVGTNQLTELTDLRSKYEAVCVCVCSSHECAFPLQGSCHRLDAAPCLRFHACAGHRSLSRVVLHKRGNIQMDWSLKHCHPLK